MIITDLKKLRKISREVSPNEVDNIVLKLKLELKKHPTGVGLAAPQIGVFKRVALVKVNRCPPLLLINPKITYGTGKIKSTEGCLSLPNFQKTVDRYEYIRYISNGTEREAFGLEAIVIQHEIDHLNGILICDK